MLTDTLTWSWLNLLSTPPPITPTHPPPSPPTPTHPPPPHRPHPHQRNMTGILNILSFTVFIIQLYPIQILRWPYIIYQWHCNCVQNTKKWPSNVEITGYSVTYLPCLKHCIAELPLRVRLICASCMDLLDIHASMNRVWVLALMEVQRYNTSNMATWSKYVMK